MTANFDTRSDAELIDICNTGDAESAEAAFAALYQRHKNFVLRVALGVVGDNAIALDTLQETFTWLLKQFPPAGKGLELTAKLTTLLYPVTRNFAISEWRRGKVLAPNADPDLLEAPGVDTANDVQRVLRELSFERREVAMLRFVHGMSLDEIAEALEVPPGTVKSRLHRARLQMRRALQAGNAQPEHNPGDSA